MKCFVFFVVFITIGNIAFCQSSLLERQKGFARVAEVFKRKEAVVKAQFESKKLTWPANFVYLRSFKYDSQLEVWVKDKEEDPFKLFTTYKVCALAGSLGPKRIQGDYQVPEGFYYINEFNPHSQYHLSLGLNYPNASDMLLSDMDTPGGDIFIHGSCVTEGCIPITNDQIEDLYIIALHAQAQGQDYIPVHIFPIQFNNTRSSDYLNRHVTMFQSYKPLAASFKDAYHYFNTHKQVPYVMVNSKGQYVVNGKAKPTSTTVIAKPKREAVEKKLPIPESDIVKNVNKHPVYPGGVKAFQSFLDSASKELVPYLEDGKKVEYITIDYIIDKTGAPIFAQVIKGGNADMNEVLEKKFESMPHWTPALRQEENVTIRLKQTVVVDAR